MNTGMAGMKILDTKICKLDHKEKTILYRGYDIKELAEHAFFEEVIHLLLEGSLPDRGQLHWCRSSLHANFILPTQLEGRTLSTLLNINPENAHPMDILKIAVSFWGTQKNTNPESLPKVLIAKIASILGFMNHKEFFGPLSNLTFAENTLRFVRNNISQPITPLASEAFNASLILYAEHELAASTFAARVTASTLSDYFSCIATAIGTLKGHLHGGANEAVMNMLTAVGKPEKAEKYIKDILLKNKGAMRKKKIMGFGHAVYKNGDPRSPIVENYSKKLSEECKDTRLYEISKIIEETMLKEKGLHPNLDFYTASIYNLLDIPTRFFTPLFVLTRSVGWSAHILEQYRNNKLIRPEANYVGPKKKKWISVKNR